MRHPTTPWALAALLAMAAPAWAGDFQTLATTSPNTTATVGANNQNSDRLYLDATSITFQDAGELIPSLIRYNAIATSGSLPRTVTATGTLTLLDFRVTEDVELAGEEIGHLYDFVYRDSRDNRLVFGTRVTLGVEPDQADDAELNFLYRRGFQSGGTTFSAAAAWLYTSNFDLRMYNAARTASGSLSGALAYDANTVRMQSDVNLAEGNPVSGLFLLKTDATRWSLGAQAIGLRQAGEEGQTPVTVDVAGFVPSVTAVPEPATWAALLLGLGVLGAVTRRSSKEG